MHIHIHIHIITYPYIYILCVCICQLCLYIYTHIYRYTHISMQWSVPMWGRTKYGMVGKVSNFKETCHPAPAGTTKASSAFLQAFNSLGASLSSLSSWMPCKNQETAQVQRVRGVLNALVETDMIHGKVPTMENDQIHQDSIVLLAADDYIDCHWIVHIYICIKSTPQNSRFSMEFSHIWHTPVEVLNLRCMGFFPKFQGEFWPLLPIICRASLWKTPPSRSFMEATADDVWFVANETNWHHGASIQIVRYV